MPEENPFALSWLEWLRGKRMGNVYLPSETGQVDERLPGAHMGQGLKRRAAEEMKQAQQRKIMQDALGGLAQR
jgi:hypothetical protein